MKHSPQVSVVIATFNAGHYLISTVESLLAQTFSNFEIIIVDDASTDGTFDLLQQKFSDSRIKVFQNNQNIGQAVSANIGISHSVGELIIRIDADDVAEPTRLAKQVAFMQANLSFHLCFTDFYCFKDDGQQLPSWNVDIQDKFFELSLLFSNNFCHSTSMYRRSFYDEYQLNYKEDFPTAQDYDLWSRMAQHTAIGYIREKLVGYRIHETNVSIKKRKSQMANVKRIILKQLHLLGLEPTDVEYYIHRHIFPARALATADFMPKIENWMQKLKDANRSVCLYDQNTFEEFLSQQYLAVRDNYDAKVARLSKSEAIKLSLKKIIGWSSISDKSIKLLNK